MISCKTSPLTKPQFCSVVARTVILSSVCREVGHRSEHKYDITCGQPWSTRFSQYATHLIRDPPQVFTISSSFRLFLLLLLRRTDHLRLGRDPIVVIHVVVDFLLDLLAR